MPNGRRVWKTEYGLRLAMLQELADVLALNAAAKGYSPKQLRDCLHLESSTDMVASLCLLHERGFVDAAEGVFTITELGLKYLAYLDNGIGEGDQPAL